jgi:hypothetical protein
MSNVVPPDVIDTPEHCGECGEPLTPQTEPEGIIFYRKEIDGRWFSIAICSADSARLGRSPMPTRVPWSALNLEPS